MVLVMKFRVNDLTNNTGAQIEFSPRLVKDFWQFTQPECDVNIECRSLVDSRFCKKVKAHLKLSEQRGDYKIYFNPDHSPTLKDVFLTDLSLKSNVNGDDYFAIKKKSETEYTLYYIPKGSLFEKFFPTIANDQILCAGDEALVEVEDLGDLQKIFYGAPGTGKSFGTDDKLKGKNVECIRVTFHPESDYSTFVGAYKPIMKADEYDAIFQTGKIVTDAAGKQSVTPESKLVRGSKISYEFHPQAFVTAYVDAWKFYAAASSVGKAKPVVLLVEEINRGNCSQIFGDLFQLLDRNDFGFSSYPIDPDADLASYLINNFKGVQLPQKFDAVLGGRDDQGNRIAKGTKLILPPNLYIWATMNTSDQSLFPIDSAFKRRWSWEYVPIRNANLGWKIVVGADASKKVYDWWSFVGKINDVIDELTSSEDKKLGYFFVKPKDKTIDEKLLVNKVFFYLWNDVFKDMVGDPALQVQINGKGHDLKFHDFFKKDDGAINVDMIKAFMDKLKVEPPAGNQQGGTAPQATETTVTE